MLLRKASDTKHFGGEVVMAEADESDATLDSNETQLSLSNSPINVLILILQAINKRS